MPSADVAGLIHQQQLAAARRTPPKPVTRDVTLKLLQIWQFDATAETTLDRAIATAQSYGFTGLLVKALDGLEWMSRFDSSPDAVDSVASVTQQWRRCADAGLRYLAWTNPRHDVDMAGEAQLTARVARACDGLLLDTEPYRQFWGPNAPVGTATAFMESVREQAADAFIGLQPDPRPAALRAIRVEEWLPFVDVLCGQHYWTDFGTDPRQELAYAQQLGDSAGLPVVPTLPGNASAASVPADLLAQLPGFIVWRLGTTGPDMLRTLGSCEVVGLSSPRLAIA